MNNRVIENRRSLSIAGLDILAVCGSLIIAYLLRFDFFIPISASNISITESFAAIIIAFFLLIYSALFALAYRFQANYFGKKVLATLEEIKKHQAGDST